MPSIDPCIDNRIFVQKGLSKKNKVDFSFYERVMERPQYISVGFENNNVNEQTHDASTFDIVNVTECYCKIGSEFYPVDRMNFIHGTNN